MLAVDQHQIQEEVAVIFFSIYFIPKKLGTLRTTATEESLEEATVSDFKSFVMPNMLLCNLYIGNYAGSQGGVGDTLLVKLMER